MVAACGAGDAGSGGVASLDDSPSAAPASDEVDGQEADATEDPAGLTEEEALLAFAECMRENGVDMEDPTVDAEGNIQFGRLRGEEPSLLTEDDLDARRAARDACSDQLAGAGPGFREADRTEIQDNLLAFAQCMRENGYEEMADPDFSNAGPGGGPVELGEVDPTDPDFQAAEEACSEILAGFGPGGGRGPGGGPGGAGG